MSGTAFSKCGKRLGSNIGFGLKHLMMSKVILSAYMLWNAKKMFLVCLYDVPFPIATSWRVCKTNWRFFWWNLSVHVRNFAAARFQSQGRLTPAGFTFFSLCRWGDAKTFYFNSWRQSVLRGDVCLSSLKWSLSRFPGGLSKKTNRCRATESRL